MYHLIKITPSLGWGLSIDVTCLFTLRTGEKERAGKGNFEKNPKHTLKVFSGRTQGNC